MFTRADAFLALAPVAIAVAWVIADAAGTLIAADRQFAAAVTPNQAAQTFEDRADAASRVRDTLSAACKRFGAGDDINGVPYSALARLCQARAELTDDLPRT